MLWLCLHFPLLPLEIFSRAQEPSGLPVVVVEKNRVLCANPPALEQGITAGLAAGTAQALCPQLRMLERQPAGEAAALLRLADWAYGFSPMLALQPPGRLLLEIAASLRLFGGLAALLARVEHELTVAGHVHEAGLAPTPRGAQLMARALPCHASALPAQDAQAFRAALARLPIALLDVPEKQQGMMRRMGFTRIGELLALPRAALGKRFGHGFLQQLQQLCGEQADPRIPHRPREFFHSALLFAEPVAECTMLLFPMRRMLGELAQFLDRRQSHCQRLEWQLGDEHGQQQLLSVPCSLAHNSHAALLDLTRLALERLQLAAAVESLVLQCRDFCAVHQHSATLFHDGGGNFVQAEKLLLDRLGIRLGEQRVYGIRPVAAHLPEQAWRRARDDAPVTDCATTAQRPAWLLQQPAPVRHGASGLDWNGRLQLLNGPERIENGWWNTPEKRDYFIARHESGALCWLFREYHSRRWFVHGLFG